VQSVAWSRQSPEVLLSGSFDKSVAMNDMKDGGQSCNKWSVEADVESLAWDPHNEHSFMVSLENGMVQAFDKRTASSNSNSGRPTFTLHAHEKAVSSISFSPSTPNFLATGSTDKMVKLWDLSNNQPSCIASLNPKLGAIFSVSFSNDSPFLLASGGSKGKLKVWNTLTEPAVANKFGK
ncbi:Os01g0924300, partial [Oryza sativa Japonica Group]